MLIFEHSEPSRRSAHQAPDMNNAVLEIPKENLRADKPMLPEVSELQAVRHYTKLSRRNFSIDTQFYPLGSCTMKYNPRAAHKIASLPGFSNRHPYALAEQSQGYMQCAYELQEILKEVTGMKGASLTTMAGAQGELAGVMMIKHYHLDRGDTERDEILVPDAAHGTNPASAVMCGFKVKEIPTGADGDIDMAGLEAALSSKTAGIMLTNPSTLGVFDRRIQEISAKVHKAGGLLYYDGANLNAILGRVRPGDMGFDVMHLNLHKTFATPHGGGGPGSGPVAVGERLLPYMPIPFVLEKQGQYVWAKEEDCPQSIGRMSTFMGNAGIILRAYIYARLLGRVGLHRVAEFATLNANYLMAKLKEAGFEVAFPERRASHEFIVTLKKETKAYKLTAMDMAKRLLDFDMHAPTTYFPLLIPECLLIEPTETETKATLDTFVNAMCSIAEEAKENIAYVKQAPYSRPVRRLDDVKAAKDLNLVYEP